LTLVDLFGTFDLWHCSSMTPWNQPETARIYARLTRSCPFYAEIAEVLAEQLVRPEDRFIVDLGAGIGTSTAPLLRHAPKSAEIWAVDPAEAMLAYGRKNEALTSVRWLCGDLRDFARLRPPGSVDLLSCSASIWFEPDFEAFLTQAAEVVAIRGRIGLTLPSEYVGEIHHLVSPPALAFSKALNEVRGAAAAHVKTDYDPLVAQEHPLPTSLDELEHQLMYHGFHGVQSTTFEAVWTAEERALWYSLPPILGQWLKGAPLEVQKMAAKDLRARAKSLPPIPIRWVLVTGERL
jgi:trans-aconitate methyltransferase